MRVTRRTLQVALGLLWLLDAALQLQPFMFTKSFAKAGIAPAGAGQPAIVSGPVHVAAQVVALHPVMANSVFAGIQLALALGLLFRPTVRYALTASIVWASAVWWLGEGLGGLTSGETLLTGAPGAALLYAVVALVAWPTREGGGRERPSTYAIPAWALLWAAGAGLQLAAGNDSGGALRMSLSDAGSDAPRWIAALDDALSRQHIANWSVAALVAVEVLVAVWALIPGTARFVSVGLGSIIILAAWLLLQGLGDLTTGQATDPNTGALVVLLGLAAVAAPTRGSVWPQARQETSAMAAVAA